MSTKFANEISDLCLKTFNNLPKTGKPDPENEWTILSCILKKDETTNKLEVVSLGTGTKCIGADALSYKGDILNDSHAEIMARRGFLRYLMEEMNLKSNIFDYSEIKKKFKLKNECTFHFFTTHSPCGDASIFNNSKNDEEEPVAKRIKFEEDENMTGGKLIKTDEKDLMSQNLGEIRTKPGRGIRTLSVSCSDKIARWNVLGIQGAMLMSLIEEPIFIKSFTIGDGVIFNVEAMERSLWKRFNQEIELKKPFLVNRPEIQIADNKKSFKYLKNDELQPSPSSIVWCKVLNRPLEVAVSGKKQGVTKKKLNTPCGRLKISKVELFIQYLDILKLFPDIKERLYGETVNLSDLMYRDVKSACEEYNTNWLYLKDNYFKVWTTKHNCMLDFKAI